jgi:hypothetical protein
LPVPKEGGSTYFGAFDLRDKKLKFISASEQRECTPTLETEAHTWVTRPGAVLTDVVKKNSEIEGSYQAQV